MGNLIYHYTSFETLIHIFASTHLYATQVFFMNDREEMSFLRKEYQIIAEGVASKIYHTSLNEEYKKVIDHQSDRKIKDIYIFCFSKLADDLSQWRAYSPGGGYAIGFDREELWEALSQNKKISNRKQINNIKVCSSKDNRFLYKFGDCIYIEKEDLPNTFLESEFFKNKDFASEEEVRLLVHKKDKNPPCIINNKPRIGIDIGCPPAKLIKEIIVSPHGEKEKIFHTAQALCLLYELNNIEIKKSNSSYQ